jgi:hypothetical protein
MSSRSLQAARARRAGENVPPVSGNRPVTSIGSQAAFAQQMPSHMSYNMPPPPNNVRTARAMQPPSNQRNNNQPPQQKQYYDQNQQHHQASNGLPFSKLSMSDAIGLITLRLGRVEQWIIDTDQENETSPKVKSEGNIPDGHKIIDNATLTTIINRLDSLEKNGGPSGTSEDLTKLIEDVKTLSEQFKRMSDDVSRHNIELAKNTEQVFRFNRELTETKDILKSFMVKYDMFAQETAQNFSDYEIALGDLEKRVSSEPELEGNNIDQIDADLIGTGLNDIDVDNNVIMSVDLKNIIKEELSKN